jgi:indoleamine 2,3-dioxygenase
MRFPLSYPLPHMDVVNVLQTPPIFFRLFVKLALSLFNSTINLSHSKLVLARPTPSSFDIDARTGFFPPRPLPRLPSGYAIWEAALRDANGNLSLGEDESEDALEKRPFGDQWRANIASVRVLLPFFSLSI